MWCGCDVAPLRAPDVLRREKCQASSLKAALGLPQKAHHHALLKGLGVPSIQVLLRKGIFRTVRSSFQEDHRLRQALACSVDEFVRRPSSLSGSFLGQVMDMCNGRLDRLLSIVLGHIPPALCSSPECADGVADSIRTASRTQNQQDRLSYFYCASLIDFISLPWLSLFTLDAE